MKNYALGYIIFRVFYRISELLRHWYVRGTRMYWHFVFDQLEAVDRVFALKINVRRWLQPLYGDYTFLGHVLGFIFRTIRIIMGVIVHGIMIVFALLVYFTWIILPLILVYGAITGDFLISKYEFIF